MARVPSNNLPIPATSFIGREREIAAIRTLLSRTRIVTLTGAGGCGKSRLALQVGAELLKCYRDGVWVVALASLFGAGLVPKAVAAALGVDENPRETIGDTVVRRVRRSMLLLVLDNCEHLRVACGELVEALTRACPGLRILATSRQPLRCEGEAVYDVPPLPLPVPSAPLVVESVKQADAVRLFTERSVAVTPTFQITETNAQAVADICRRLDGIPLAIEMAAVRMKVLSEEEILSRLDDRFSLLTRDETRFPQHQTLRAVFDWSHALLSRQEQTLLLRVAVFAGGWTLDAAESVCAGNPIEAGEVLDPLTGLVDKSMVVAEKRPEGIRFRLLESVREYALERLAQADEGAELRRRHLAWCLRVAEEADAAVRGPDQDRWWGQFDVELDNFRSAFEWAMLDPDGAASGMRLASALGLFWSVRGNLREGLEWFERAISRSGDASHAVRVRALGGAAFLARGMGRLDQSAAFADGALGLARECREPLCLGIGLLWAGGAALDSRDLNRAEALFSESLQHFTDLSDPWRAAAATASLADVARLRGDLQLATAYLERCAALSRETGDRRRIAQTLRGLGDLAIRKRDPRSAAALFAESLRIARQFKAPRTVAANLAGLAAVAALHAQFRQTARLFGAAAAQRDAVGAPISAEDQAGEEQVAGLARRAIGERAFASAFAEGRALTLDQAAEYALREFDARAAGGSGRDCGPLTRRELQIASLLANGLTNRAMASLLGTSERTVESHVQHILNKLGLSTRAQIAVWSMQNEVHEAGPGANPRAHRKSPS